MDDLNEGVSLQKAAQVRLYNLGQIKSLSTFINDPTRLDIMRERYELQRSLGRRDEIERLGVEERMEPEKAKLGTKLPDAVKIFANNETGKRAFTKECATYILLIIFGKPHSKSLVKKELIKLLDTEDKHKPELMIDAITKYNSKLSNLPELPAHSQLADSSSAELSQS